MKERKDKDAIALIKTIQGGKKETKYKFWGRSSHHGVLATGMVTQRDQAHTPSFYSLVAVPPLFPLAILATNCGTSCYILSEFPRNNIK